MKHKKLFRSVTALLAALVLMGGFSVTAFAGGGDVSDEPPTPVTETEPEETTGGYEPQPLTPEGNMSLGLWYIHSPYGSWMIITELFPYETDVFFLA